MIKYIQFNYIFISICRLPFLLPHVFGQREMASGLEHLAALHNSDSPQVMGQACLASSVLQLTALHNAGSPMII